MEGGEKIKEERGKNQKMSSSPCQSSISSSESDNVEEDSVIHKKVRIISKTEESRWELPDDMTKYAIKFSQKYIPENDLEKNVTKYNPASTNIGRSKDVDDSYLAATSVK